jgi:hypothetical protein
MTGPSYLRVGDADLQGLGAAGKGGVEVKLGLAKLRPGPTHATDCFLGLGAALKAKG